LKNLVSAAGFEPATHALKGPAARQLKDLACINESQFIGISSRFGAGFSDQRRNPSQRVALGSGDKTGDSFSLIQAAATAGAHLEIYPLP